MLAPLDSLVVVEEPGKVQLEILCILRVWVVYEPPGWARVCDESLEGFRGKDFGARLVAALDQACRIRRVKTVALRVRVIVSGNWMKGIDLLYVIVSEGPTTYRVHYLLSHAR